MFKFKHLYKLTVIILLLVIIYMLYSHNIKEQYKGIVTLVRKNQNIADQASGGNIADQSAGGMLSSY